VQRNGQRTRVEVFHWNPRRPVLRGRAGALLPIRRRVNNFGDLLGPLIVSRLVASNGLDITRPVQTARLLSVGSVLHFARTGDVVWGSGVNGKIPSTEHRYRDLDVRAVRGPITQEFLTKRGVSVPDVYGDPAILLGELMPELQARSGARKHPLTVVPNLNDFHEYGVTPERLNPRAPLLACIQRCRDSDLVVGSSLHGIIVAEALGVAARPVISAAESPLKYEDYFAGTGRSSVDFAQNVAEAVEMGGVTPPVIDRERLIAAFPRDLWEGSSLSSSAP
jgi:pyruvyltransferase